MGDNKSLIFDIGSLNSKIGFSDEEEPRVIPSVVGKLKYSWCGMIGDPNMPPSYFVGHDSFSKKYKLVNKRPVQGEIIVDWDDYERLLDYCYHKILGKEPEVENNILLIESPLNSKFNREKITQIMFETLNVNSFYISTQPQLSLHSINKNTGIVVQCGHCSTYVVPIINGIIVNHAITTFKLSGKQIDQCLLKLLTNGTNSGNNSNNNGGNIMRSCVDFNILLKKIDNDLIERLVCDIKESLCSISLDFEEEIREYGDETKEFYISPDEYISFKKNILIKCTEILFKASIIDSEINCSGGGIADIVYSSIMKCNENVRDELLSNIITTGGTTLTKGFNERLIKELLLLSPLSSIKIIPTPIYSSFFGGSILSNDLLFKSKWITKEIYDENGPQIINKL